MTQIAHQMIPMIVGLLLSPIPAAALIVMLMTNRARRNGLAFVLGWLLGIFGVGLIVISFPGLGASTATPSGDGFGLIRMTIGLTLISWAIYKAYRRYHTIQPETPAFFERLDHISVSRAFGIGLLVSAGNIKNLGFSAAAALMLNQAVLGFSASIPYLIGYSLAGSMTLMIPFGLYVLMHHRADPLLERWKNWLISNHIYVLSGVVIYVGLMIIRGGA